MVKYTPFFAPPVSRRKALNRFAGLLLIALFYSVPAGADSTPTLRFITIEVAPWAYREAGTEGNQGAFFDIVAALEEATDLRIETTLTPFARVDRELEAGTHDCTILVPRDETIVRLGEPVTDHDIGVISRKQAPLESHEDLQGHTISLLRGSSISPEFDRDTDIDKVYETDYMMALRKLDRGRVDGVAGAIPTLLHLAEQEGMADRLAPPLALMEVPLVFQCSRRSEHLDRMPVLNEAIRSLRQNGTLEAINQRYDF